MSKFSVRLKELRFEKGLSTFMPSRAVGIGVASINRWENGKSDIKSEQLIVPAKFFNFLRIIY